MAEQLSDRLRFYKKRKQIAEANYNNLKAQGLLTESEKFSINNYPEYIRWHIRIRKQMAAMDTSTRAEMGH